MQLIHLIRQQPVTFYAAYTMPVYEYMYIRCYSIAIQCWPQFHFVDFPILTKLSLQNFASGMTVHYRGMGKMCCCFQQLKYNNAKFHSNLNREQRWLVKFIPVLVLCCVHKTEAKVFTLPNEPPVLPIYRMLSISFNTLSGFHMLPLVALSHQHHAFSFTVIAMAWLLLGTSLYILGRLGLAWSHAKKNPRFSLARGQYSSQPLGASDLPWVGHCVALKWSIVSTFLPFSSPIDNGC